MDKMQLKNVTKEELVKIHKELYLKAYKYLVEKYGNFDIQKVKLSDNVLSACSVAQIHERECARCDKAKCKRRAILEIQPIVSTATLEITGFKVGARRCKVAEEAETKNKSSQWG